MGNICSDTCKRDNPEQHRQTIVSSIPYLAHFKARTAITNVSDMAFPISTDGASIVDSFGRRVKICSYNLKGCHSTKACVSALEHLSLEDMAHRIKENGFNTVIIPFSLDLFFENPRIEDQSLASNGWMKGKKALDVLDITINGLTRIGLLVMLRNACSKASYFREFTESDGLWWSEKYRQAKWIECLKGLTMRYMHNPRVFAFQIRHTIKSTPNHEFTWGDGNQLTDWKRAATFACNQILDINPNIIVVVTGGTRGDLRDIANSPIQLKLKNKLMYCAKLKPFAEKPKSFQQLRGYIDQSLFCVRKVGFPLMLTTVTDRKQADWKHLIDFLEETDLDWGYSSYPKGPSKESWHLFSNDRILDDLRRIQVSTVAASAPLPTPVQDMQEHRPYAATLNPAPLPASARHHTPHLESQQQRNSQMVL